MLFLGAPVLYAVLIGSVYQKGKVVEMPIVVVNEDGGPMSDTFIDMLNDNESVRIARILPSLFNSKDIAIDNEATTIVHIPRGFSADVQQSRLPEITIFVDGSNTLTSNTAMMAVNIVATTMKAGVLIQSQMKKGVPEYIATQHFEPFKTTIVRQNIRSGNYLYFMLPGVLITVLQQVLLLGLALSFSTEFEKNTFGELVTRMSNPLGLILVKVLPYLLMSVGILFFYWVMSFYYKVPLHTDFWWFALCTFIFILAASLIGILVSIAIPSQLKATEILMVVATPAFILSGFTWPSSLMPSWVQWIADAIPTTHYLRIYRMLFIQQADLYHTHRPLIILCVIAVVCLILSVLLLWLKMRKAKRTELTIGDTEK